MISCFLLIAKCISRLILIVLLMPTTHFLMSDKIFCQTITFQKIFGSPLHEYGSSIRECADRGYIITGYTNNTENLDPDVYLIKTNEFGDTLWTKRYGGSNWDEGTSVVQSYDGGYVVSGLTQSFGNGFPDIFLFSTDSLGVINWFKTYGGLKDDRAFDMQQTNDSGYIVVGRTYSFGQGDDDIYLLRMDKNGDTVWTRVINITSPAVGYAVLQTKDYGFMISGSVDNGSSDIILIKTDNLGNITWTRIYGGINHEDSFDVKETNDSGFVVIGQTLSFGAGASDVYLIKTNYSGDTLWTRTFGERGIDIGYSIDITNNNGFIITGGTQDTMGNIDIYLIKTNSSGDSLWTSKFDNGINDQGKSVIQTSDGGFALLGWTLTDPFPGHINIFLIKTNENGLITSLDDTIIKYTTPYHFDILQNYPNPFNPSTVIRYQLSVASQVKLSIFNLLGQEIATLVDEHKPQGSYGVEWNAEKFSSGIYFYRLTAGNFVKTKKLVLLK